MIPPWMPSPIGHALAGVAFVWSVKPRAERRLVLTAVALAVVPDLDLVHPDWHRAFTHSLGAVLLVTIITAAVTGRVTRRIAWPVVMVCGGAYATHLLLDWLGADFFAPYGIRALWPFDDGWYISGLDLFRQTARRHLFTLPIIMQNVKAIAQEMAILGPIAYALWLVRVKPAARLAPELTSRDHPAQ
jgi:membrane-bound metal-dependent hydrolase YbcI (DUF457 family)